MMTQWQNFFYENFFAYAHQKNLNFVKLTETIDVQSQRFVIFIEITDKFQWLLTTDGFALLEIVVNSKIFMLFMIGIEKSLHEFLIYDENMFFCFRLVF